MWIIQEPNEVELWNKRHFEEKRTEIMQPRVLSLSCLIQILQISQDNVRKVKFPLHW
jgi:hypothetical protein